MRGPGPFALDTPPPSDVFCSLHPVTLSDTLGPSLHGLARLVGARRAIVVTERRLEPILSPHLRSLSVRLGGAPVLTFTGGERHKTRRTKERLEDALLRLGADRGSMLVAVGGGVVTDMVGFTAATFMRGIPYASVPTTLLGMVDAALGGKTAVDTPRGKNLVGSFHPPAGVFVALEMLDTLPKRQFLCGLAECLKHGLFMDAGYFGWLGRTSWKGLRTTRSLQDTMVRTSLGLKCAVVDEDPKEATGRRNILNAGHTVGHALEHLSSFRLSHGEAVAAGLLWEAAAAVSQGHLSGGELAPIRAALERLRLTPVWRELAPERVFEAAGADKKNLDGRVAYIPLKSIGAAAFPPPHTADLTVKALAEGRHLLGGR